jgi:hypothetical protein
MPFRVITDDTDLFVLKEEGLDDVEDLLGDSFFLLLRNFPLNESGLRQAHVDTLGGWVVPYLKRPAGFAEIYAMTDRSGTPGVNYKVSASRLSEVQQKMVYLGASRTKVYHGFAKALGEDYFAEKMPDGKKDPSLRSVAIALSPAPIGVPTKRFRSFTARDLTVFGRHYKPTGG